MEANKEYKKIKDTQFLIDEFGTIYDSKKQKVVKLRRIKYKNTTIGKKAALLLAFYNIEPKPAKTIVLIDSEKGLKADNLKYAAQTETSTIEKTSIETALKKIVALPKNYKFDLSNVENKIYLKIAFDENLHQLQRIEHINIFADYISSLQSVKETSEKYNLSIRDTKNIIHNFINEIAKAVNNNNNYKELQTITPAPKPTKKQLLKQWRNEIKKYKID